MADTALLQALDYILNHSDDASIEVLAEAVIRRKRSLSVFHAMGGIPDPQIMAKEITERISAGLGSGIEGMKRSVRDMIVRIIHEHAPELSDKQVDELCQAWLPDSPGSASGKALLQPDALSTMIDQFVSFSNGTMSKSLDKSLREEIGAWPARYWQAFPPVIRQIITDYIKGKITQKDFKSKIALSLGI